MGVQNLDSITFELNRELFPTILSPQEVVELRNLYADGLISREAVWARLREAGWIDAETTDDDLDQQIGDGIGDEMSNSVDSVN